mmetsp:Transcript_21826/g.52153  ORF Transcript_21826/g.52153 Transcript_21826/m.52153 type:complete len:240 (-) Transcript_21826:933-1652(-)
MLLEIYNAVTGVLFHLLEPSNLGITGVSIFTVYLSSLRALEHERFIAETKDDSLQVTLSSLQAAIFPFVASIFLIFMFYFFSSVSLIYISMAVFTSWAAVAFAFAPLASVTPSWQALSGVSPVKHDSKVAAGNCRTQMVFGSKARTAGEPFLARTVCNSSVCTFSPSLFEIGPHLPVEQCWKTRYAVCWVASALSRPRFPGGKPPEISVAYRAERNGAASPAVLSPAPRSPHPSLIGHG